MRIVVHDFAGHPFQVQLSRALARRGHDVLHLYCGAVLTPRGALDRVADDPDALLIETVVPRRPIDKTALISRWISEREYAARLARRVVAFAPQVVISANAPLEAQARLQGACRRHNARFVFWVQDLIGEGAQRVLAGRWGAVGRLVGGHFRRFEQRLLRDSDHVVLITDDFRPLMHAAGVDPASISVIENWAPLHELPTVPHDNPWARAHGLHDRTVLLYSGTLGMKHNPALLLDLARRVESRDDVRVVVISEGRGARWLAERKAELGLERLLLLPFQPYEQMAAVLGTADVLLAILEQDAGVFSVPSKVLTSLCAGRALLLAVPAENLAARIVRNCRAGLVVEPDDAAGFVSSALQLIDDAGSRGEMALRARSYAESRFDIERIVKAFETIASGAPASPNHGAAPGATISARSAAGNES